MDHFQYRDGQLFAEGVSVDEIARQVGTPAYVYSRKTFELHYDRLARAFASLRPLLCYSIKSCGNVHLVKLLADRGAGMDVVSGGELFRALKARPHPHNILNARVGPTPTEIRDAIDHRIGLFNIESEAEFENIAAIARAMGQTAHAALRINPDVDPQTAHAKTTTGTKETKFGVDLDRARRFFERYGRDKHLKLTALHLHIGSPVYKVEPYVAAVTKALALIDDLRKAGHHVTTIDLGGGFGADYVADQTPDYQDYAAAIAPLLQPFVDHGGRVILEPGRTIAANAGILVTRVQYLKMGGRKKFVIIDSGMHHLIRPTLYDSYHFIWPTQVAPQHAPQARLKQHDDMPGLEPCDVVGPICETGDFLAKDRPRPPGARGDLLAGVAAGAYGMVRASNYNAVPRPVEVLVDGDKATVIRRRETYDDLLAPELDAAPL